MIWLVILAIPLLYLFYRYAIKGKIGNFSSGVGNALFQANSFVRPSTQNIVEAKKQHREEKERGDDDPPELPPWAQSGN